METPESYVKNGIMVWNKATLMEYEKQFDGDFKKIRKQVLEDWYNSLAGDYLPLTIHKPTKHEIRRRCDILEEREKTYMQLITDCLNFGDVTNEETEKLMEDYEKMPQEDIFLRDSLFDEKYDLDSPMASE